MPRRETGIYHRKDGLWEARYVKEIDLNGKKIYASLYGHSYLEAKEKRQAAVESIALYQKPLSMRSITINELIEEYLYVNKNRIKPATYQRYKGLLNNHISKVIGDRPVVYCTTLTIHEFALNRLKYGLLEQTVNAILLFLHVCLKYGHRQYKLPLPEIVYLTPKRKEMRVLSKEEQGRLMQYLLKDIDIYKFGVILTLFTGLRIGELCALEKNDIDEYKIKINKTMQRLQKTPGETMLNIGPPKTPTSNREIPIPSFLREYIKFFKEQNPNQKYMLGTSKMPIVEPRIMQLKFKKYLEDAGIEHANFHALRHSFATRAIECGFEVTSLSAVLGHSTVVTTMDRYVHPSFQLQKEGIERLSVLL